MGSGGIGAEVVVFPRVGTMWAAEFERAVLAPKGRQGARLLFRDTPGFREGRNGANHLRQDDVATALSVNAFFDAPANAALLNIATREINHQGECESNADDCQHNVELRSRSGSLRAQEHFRDVIHGD
jgi:hypothetical protein